MRTLGGLELEGPGFTRPKPLLLLAYLTLNGSSDRHHVARLFFSDDVDRMQSLRITLSRLRWELPLVLEVDRERLRTSVVCDVHGLISSLDAGSFDDGAALYSGAFLTGVNLVHGNAELEEWVFFTREWIASRVRTAQMLLAEQFAA